MSPAARNELSPWDLIWEVSAGLVRKGKQLSIIGCDILILMFRVGLLPRTYSHFYQKNYSASTHVKGHQQQHMATKVDSDVIGFRNKSRVSKQASERNIKDAQCP